MKNITKIIVASLVIATAANADNYWSDDLKENVRRTVAVIKATAKCQLMHDFVRYDIEIPSGEGVAYKTVLQFEVEDPDYYSDEAFRLRDEQMDKDFSELKDYFSPPFSKEDISQKDKDYVEYKTKQIKAEEKTNIEVNFGIYGAKHFDKEFRKCADSLMGFKTLLKKAE